MDLLKTVLALSTGAVGFYFSQVSGNSTLVQPGVHRWVILGALLSFVVAALLGLAGWVVMFRLYYISAKAVEAGPGSVYEAHRQKLKQLRNVAFRALPLAFALGVLLSTWAICIRLL